jgi:ATPase subunit of ABC transporter with duplicated ATPase domains
MAKSRQKKLDKMEVLEKPKTSNSKIYLNFNYQSISSHKFLEVKDLEIGYYSSLLPPMSFEIKSGTKISIQGFNGIGKTTLLKTLIGELKPIKGMYKFVDDAKFAYYEQDHNWENPNESAFQLISNLYPKMNEKEIRSVLARCAITGGLALQPLNTLSGGEQSKVKLCLVMLKKANVLILDEPTNHLDSVAKESSNNSLLPISVYSLIGVAIAVLGSVFAPVSMIYLIIGIILEITLMLLGPIAIIISIIKILGNKKEVE